MPADSATDSRRGFLKTSAGLVMGTTLAGTLAIPRAVHAGVDETVRVGLIGAGLRGTAAAENALAAHPDNRLVAIGDAFLDVAQNSRDKLRRSKYSSQLQVADEQLFAGFDAYKKVVDSGVDVVLLAQPPHFRPVSLAYAIDQGKHCFVEKPIAVDAPGVRSVVETCRRAKEKNLAVVSGLCWRYQPAVQETIRRIKEDKAIGDIIAIQSNFNSGPLWHRGDKPDWSRMEYEVRNWTYFRWLAGDIILEQAIHSLDKCAWLLDDCQPLSAFGLGGRQQRTQPEYGDVYDHFAVFYEFPKQVRVAFSCRQQADCSNLVDECVLGTKGQAWLLKHRIEGENPWRFTGRKPDMYDAEHVALFDSIRNGTPINNGDYMTNSNLIALLGRQATYSGQTLDWDTCVNSSERLGPTSYEWTDHVPPIEVPIPGQFKAI